MNLDWMNCKGTLTCTLAFELILFKWKANFVAHFQILVSILSVGQHCNLRLLQLVSFNTIYITFLYSLM